MPHLKSSQVAVKGKVEPATLVGFIHKCTGRRAAIIRAEPLDDALLPQPPNPPAAPPSKAESKKDEPPAENPPAKVEDEENRGGGGKDNADDDNPKTEKPASDGHGAAEEHGAHVTTEAPDRDNDDDAGDGLVLENHTKAAVDRLFAVPTPAGGVVTVVAPEMVLGSRSYCYPAYPCAQYYYPYQQHLYPPQPYPAASAYSPVAMYGYPASYPPEAFSEENPNACTVV